MEFKGFGGNKLKDFKQIIAKQISKTIDINEEELESYIETPKDSKNGDYAFPCFRLAKELRKAPPAIANEIKEKIEAVEEIEKIEVAGGYLNFFINKSILTEEVLEEISKINNIEMYILSLSKTKKITEKKKIWLKKYVPFIKEENWIILTKEIGEYSNENRNEIKGKNIELRQKDYDKSIMLDDEQVVLREAKKILNDKIEVFHISSALI